MNRYQNIIVFALFFVCMTAYADLNASLKRLKCAYPDQIEDISAESITWHDGSRTEIHVPTATANQQERLANPTLYDQLMDAPYQSGRLVAAPITDVGRIRYSPFFQKIYGETQADVESKLVTVYWMPQIFGAAYPLDVTSVAGLDQIIRDISTELELLVLKHPEYKIYLQAPGGVYKWRMVSGTNRLSPHCFGMSIDINPNASDYWRYDLEAAGVPVNESTPIKYKNKIPWEIVRVFEKHGFIWGGKWRHYDTMHFEYRPELLLQKQCQKN